VPRAIATAAYFPNRGPQGGPQREIQGEIIDPRIADVEALARWFDYAFVLPGGFRFGLAGIIGLVPGVGDVIDSVVSVYIVHRAVQLGATRATVARMMLNIGVEALAGTVPLFGDVFDVAFKANRRNYQLLRKHMAQPRKQTALDRLYLMGAVLLAVLAVALPLLGLVALFRLLSR
jgi:hypothetical protein